MRNAMLVIGMLLPALVGAQAVRWADRVVEVTSQEDSSAAFLTGPPDGRSWSPSEADNYLGEVLRLRFGAPVLAEGAVLVESENPGALHLLLAAESTGRETLLYENPFPEPQDLAARRLEVPFSTGPVWVSELVVELKTNAVPGFNRLDAVGLLLPEASPPAPPTETLQPKAPPRIVGAFSDSPRQLGPGVNSPQFEGFPLISPDGGTLWFVREGHPTNLGAADAADLWMSRRLDDGSWGTAVNLGTPMNGPGRERPAGLTLPDQSLFFLRKEDTRSALIQGRWTGRSWLELVPTAPNLPPDVVSAHLHPAGKVLVFSAPVPGRGLDLFVCLADAEGRWGAPRPLGPGLNSGGDETGPFLAADGKTLFFASNGHPGNGGFDLFRSRRLDDSWTQWSAPENLGSPVNSPADETFASVPASGSRLFYTSNTKGDGELFSIPLPPALQPEPVRMLQGHCVYEEGKPAREARLRWEVPGEAPREQPLDVLEGRFQLLLPNTGRLVLSVQEPGYFPVTQVFEGGRQPHQELDGQNPAVADPGTALDPAVERLQLEVLQLKRELAALRAEVEALKSGGVVLEQLPKSPFQNIEVEALRAEFERHLQPAPTPEPLTQTLDTLQSAEELPPPEPESDLERMKRQYRRAHGLEEPEPLSTRDLLRTTRQPEDAELQALKERYRRLHGQAPEQTPQRSTPLQGEALPLRFEQLEEAARLELEAEYAPRIYQELTRSLLPEVLEELYDSLPAPEREWLFSGEFSRELNARLRRDSARVHLPEPPPALPLDEPYLRQLYGELRKALEREVQAALWHQLRKGVKERLRRETLLLWKEKREAALVQEMEQQARERKSLPAEARPARPSSAPTDPTDTAAVLTLPLVLHPARPGTRFLLEGVFFHADAHHLRPESFPALDALAAFLREHPALRLRFEVHTNGWCSESFARMLTQNRAEVLVEYLSQKGVPSERLLPVGKGKSHPLAPNSDPQGRGSNQRVEVFVLE